jgi:ribonucleoside-diphosphate reductase alpha chain
VAMAPEQVGIGIRRYFTKPGTHPYDMVEWEEREARIPNWKDGTDAFFQPDVEFPVTWSQNSTNIVAQKYFRGTLGTAERETSLRQVIDRVADTITGWGVQDGYFVDEQEGAAFRNELKAILVTQRAAFNSPVWFNIGVEGVPQQGSACQPYDALVSTVEGLVPIGKLVDENAVGTKVFDAHGITKIVATKSNGRKEVLRVHTKAGTTLDVTPDHLVWRSRRGEGSDFVEAGTLRPGDQLEWHDVESGDVRTPEIARIESLGAMDVYDIQTESGEYLSGSLRVHNCFILAVDDTMDGILNWYREEGTIFKGGSGSGINLSNIRSSYEHLKGGGTASGPVSFMRGADASAGTIKSGGKTRRAAKMVILNADHPDIEEFIWCKSREEHKARALRDAGFDMDLDGKDSHSIQYQNANNSVRVTDEFMQAVVDDADWDLKAVITGETIRTVRARDLFRQISQAAWECADPGMQFDTTINRWHTAPNSGRINGSNPCSEYMHIDNSACNLASINLLKYLDDDGTFDVEAYKHTVEVMFTAQEIVVGNADYPTEKIAENSRKFRQLGLGYANLGALLMAQGMPYDSDAGRAWAAALTALMTGHAYATSARTAGRMGPFAGYAENADAMNNVLRMHRAEASKIDEELVPPELLGAAQQAWDEAVELGETFGVRNSQATVLAPTGCLVGGSLVPTERGLVRLGSLGDPIGDQWQPLGMTVQTDEGPREATQFYVNGVESVVTVESKRGYRIRGTAKHRIKVVDETGDWVWRRLADVRPGDRVPLSLHQLVGTPQEVVLPPLAEAHWTKEHRVRAPRTMTPELAEFVGYFMGDGSLHSKGLRLCVAADDFDVVEHLSRLGKELFGLEAAVSAQQGYTEVAFHSVRLALWWEACGFAKHAPHESHSGKGYTPHIPDAVLHANDREVYAAFVRGLFEADGTVTVGIPTWTTARVSFADEVQSLLLALGFPTTRKHDVSGRGSVLSSLRLLNTSYHDAWMSEIGFLSGRKSARVVSSVGRQAARQDHIPVTRSMIDRLAPENDRLHKVLLAEVARGRVSRRAASELFERTHDAELGHLLEFFYDEVVSAELGDEEFTYDLSVPSNVTYVANGFVSHNTIGLMMDCDTTGIEPDLALTKAKKLVGGGTMMIVNQTIPRALSQLGYSNDEVTAILAHINEQKTIFGAPHFKAEHLPVFACSMGDNTIHYMGHVKMMGAVQPFISGAISKTVNMPEDVSVEDVEELHIEAWRLGLKAVALYRDNCKVAQPLATQKKGGETGSPEAAATALANGAPAQIVERIVEHVIVQEPVRQKLPRMRNSKTFSFRVADCHGYATIGEFPDGRPGEVFLKVAKQGSTLAGIMDAFAISLSLGLQYGVPIEAFAEKFTNMRFEPAGMTDDPDLRIATSLVDYIFRRLVVEYVPYETRRDMGVLTVGERTQPTLPGVEEASIPNETTYAELPLEDQAPSASIITPSTEPPLTPGTHVMRASETVLCHICGDIMQRAGSCHACPSCGATSGCS